jgi:hypothetical protein
MGRLTLSKPVAVALLDGRPISTVWAAEHVPTGSETWQPGTQGGPAVVRLRKRENARNNHDSSIIQC